MAITKTKRDTRRTGNNPLAYMGVEPLSPPNLTTDSRAPTPNDYAGFFVGDMWVDRSTAPHEDVYMLVNKDNNVARWLQLRDEDFIKTLTGNNPGEIVGPNVLQNVFLLGAAPLIVTGDAATWTLSIGTDGTLATQYDTNAGSAAPAAGILKIIGAIGGHITTSGGTNEVSIEVTGDIASRYDTDAGNAVPAVGILQVLGGELINTGGGTNIVTANLDRGSDGQIIIAATGAISAYANILSADNSVTIVNTANAIDLAVAAFPITGIGYYNIGMTVDVGATTITMHSADGTAFSATNKGLVSFASKATPGTFVRLGVTANVSMAWADMTGNNMGMETAKAWADNVPLYVYAVMNEAEDALTFGLARMPHHGGSGVLANIGTPAVANANAELSLFLFDSVTIADYDDTPVVVLGSLKATKAITTDAWTFSAIKGGDTGVGGFQLGTSFAFPPLQNGAVNNHMYVVAGTVPTWANSHYNYGVSTDGYIQMDFACNQLQVVGVSSGTQALWLMVPLRGTLVRRAGVGGVADQSVSVAAYRGVYNTLYIDSLLANGYSGIQGIKNAGRRLRAGDFDTVNGFNAQYFGGHSYMMANNQLP